MPRSSALFVAVTLIGCAGTPQPRPTALPPAAPPVEKPSPAAAAPPAPTAEVRELSGRLGRVRLLRAFRIADDDARLYGAPSGLGFEFLIIRPPGVKGNITLRELRDVTLSGNSYREVTRKTLGGVFEPQSEIGIPSTMRVAGGLTVAEAYAVSDDDASVMRTLLYGVRIRGVGPVVVVADIGFGDNEKHTFTVPLETIQTEPATY